MRPIIGMAVLSAALLIAAGAVSGKSKEPDTPHSSKTSGVTRLDHYLSLAAAAGVPSQVLVTRNDQLLLHRTYGVETRSNSREPAFWLASTSKHFVAAAILRLVDQGKLSTSDTIAKLFPEAPADKEAITLHQLLTHTSGFGGENVASDVKGRDAAVAAILTARLSAAPGTEYRYSNDGYTMLAAIVEITSGQRYEDFIREQFLKPLGLDGTGVFREWWEGATSCGNAPLAPVKTRPQKGGNYGWQHGICSCVGDLYRWQRALLVDRRVLSPKSTQAMVTPYVDAEPGMKYGYGWFIGKNSRGSTTIQHDGGDDAIEASSIVIRYVDEKSTIIVLSNAGEHGVLPIPAISLARRVENLTLDADREKLLLGTDSVALTTLRIGIPTDVRYAGRYRSVGGAIFDIDATDPQRLVLRPENEAATAALLAAEPPFASVLGARSESADRVFAALSRGDTGPIEELAQPGSRERVAQTIRSQWSQWVKNSGAFRGYQVLGTVPVWWRPDTDPATLVRLNFDRDSFVRRIHWTAAGQYAGLGGGAVISPLPTSLVPLKQARHYIGVMIGPALTVEVSFDGTGGLRIRNRWKQILATRSQ